MVSRRFLRIKALKSLYGHISSTEEGLIPAQKKMLFSITKSHELYHLMLRLVVELSDYAKEVEQTKSTLLMPNGVKPSFRLAHNALADKLRNCEELNSFLKKNNLAWSRDNELMKNLYTKLVETDYYKEYIEKETITWNDDRDVIVKFLRKEIEDNEFFYSIVEDMSIYWIDEIEFFTSQVATQLSRQKENRGVELKGMFRDDSDIDFVKDLFVQSILQYDDNVAIIKRFAKNWDVERITVMDRLIIIMAIVELEKFANIPTNVTLDEYIEVSKHYSTLNSSIFINGILHKYVTENNITK